MIERATCELETAHGGFLVRYFESFWRKKKYIALTHGVISMDLLPMVRLQSGCLFGTAFHSAQCDCGQQLDDAMQRIVEHGQGVVVYAIDDEGRGNGLKRKIESMYAETIAGADYYAAVARDRLTIKRDKRTYANEVRILRRLSTSTRIRVLTNNEQKRAALKCAGFVLR